MNKRFIRSLIIAIIFVLLLAVPVLAAYSAIITITESAGTSYTQLPIINTMNVSNLASSHYIASTGLDTRILDNGTELPHLLADDKVLFVSDITANSTKQFDFTTSNSALTSFPIIVGEGGYVTIPDNDTLELGDRFVLTISVDLENTGTVFDKLDALRADYNATTQVLTITIGTYAAPDHVLTATGITKGIHVIKISADYTGISSSVILYPNGAGDYQNIDGEEPNGMAHWSILRENTGTQFVWYADSETADLYAFDSGIFNFDSLTMNMYSAANYPDSNFKFLIKMPGYSLYTSESHDPYVHTGVSAYPKTFATNPITNEAWNASDMNGIQFGFSCQRYSGSIAAIGMEVVLNNAQNLAELNLYVDDMVIPADSESLSSPISDNSNDWIWYPDPYINYIKLETDN
jgi:hypothetical protein